MRHLFLTHRAPHATHRTPQIAYRKPHTALGTHCTPHAARRTPHAARRIVHTNTKPHTPHTVHHTPHTAHPAVPSLLFLWSVLIVCIFVPSEPSATLLSRCGVPPQRGSPNPSNEYTHDPLIDLLAQVITSTASLLSSLQIGSFRPECLLQVQ